MMTMDYDTLEEVNKEDLDLDFPSMLEIVNLSIFDVIDQFNEEGCYITTYYGSFNEILFHVYDPDRGIHYDNLTEEDIKEWRK